MLKVRVDYESLNKAFTASLIQFKKKKVNLSEQGWSRLFEELPTLLEMMCFKVEDDTIICHAEYSLLDWMHAPIIKAINARL